MSLLLKKDIEYSNINFWYYYIMCFRGFDEQKELNLDDALGEVIDAETELPSFNLWYNHFFSQSIDQPQQEDSEPKVIAGKLIDELRLTIKLYTDETVFYLNDIYIGNLGGHFEAWYLTLDELLAFDTYDYLFLLLLPMTGIEKEERQRVESLIEERLKLIPLFAMQSEYIAQWIVNGLIIDKAFSLVEGVGITSNTNHSMRNIEKYPQNKEDVIEMNRILKAFVSKQNT